MHTLRIMLPRRASQSASLYPGRYTDTVDWPLTVVAHSPAIGNSNNGNNGDSGSRSSVSAASPRREPNDGSRGRSGSNCIMLRRRTIAATRPWEPPVVCRSVCECVCFELSRVNGREEKRRKKEKRETTGFRPRHYGEKKAWAKWW